MIRATALILLSILLLSRPCVASDPVYPSLKPRVRIFYDVARVDDDLKKIEDNDGFASARIGLLARMSQTTDILIDYEFKDRLNRGTQPLLRYAYVEHRFGTGSYLVLGQTDEPFGLDANTSNRFTSFLERALPFSFVPYYHLGLVGGHEFSRGGVVVGVFGKNIGQQNNDGGNGTSFRAFFSPIFSGSTIMHVGGSVSYREPDSNSVRFSSRPEISIIEPKLVDTGELSSKYSFATGLEFLFIKDSFSVQAELINAKIDSGNDFYGTYILASYLINGSSKKFIAKRGTHHGNTGAGSRSGEWEVVARISKIDLDDGAIKGGTLIDRTVGVNYSYSPEMRIMFNFISTKLNRRNSLDRPKIFALRLQMGF